MSTESLGYGMEIRRITHNYWRSQDELSIGLKEVHDVIKGQTAENLADFGGPIYLDSFKLSIFEWDELFPKITCGKPTFEVLLQP